MSNVLCVAWRTPCLGLRPSSLRPPDLAIPPRSLTRQNSPTWSLDSNLQWLQSSRRPFSLLFPTSSAPAKCLPFSRRLQCFQSSAALSSNKPAPHPVEKGAKLRDVPFSKTEIAQIFGSQVKLSPAMGNRVLSVLQARRLAGTLDLDFPVDIGRAARPSTLDAGLEYLRRHYPMDEDAAILARIEREEQEMEEKLAREAEELGLYKPQSGSYGAQLGEQNDPSGKSILKQIREQNEKRILAQTEKERQEWLEGEERHREQMRQHRAKNTSLQKFEDTSALEVQGRADPNQRPLLAWIQKHHLRATDTETDFSQLTMSSRLIPALIFTLISLGLCYGFAVTYQPPAKADLHDDIGRGNFLALYLASGVFGSFASLSVLVLRNLLHATSLGASGATAGVLAASALIHPGTNWTISFLPTEWQDFVSAPAWMLFAGLVTLDIAGSLLNRRAPKLDYFAHLGGYSVGAVFALAHRSKR
ncbi:rhomboid protease PCP1 [Aspergillus mulundensis]|uniref:Peptidase S54 rhomboid domain-containing protein n=1 Tax=Aspergillus mulundensis TaxID=1810919 RepID=A0A3D8RQK1_9EURO|nr:hypothetical protein DSM5745_06232 [Aspergillus mulundensis]RDW76240.1 hypothetical protein DSM5745_06232 [Aspergillus mulundensis]